MTPKQAAATLNVSDQTIYNWSAAGIFQDVTSRGVFKKRYTIPASEVERVRALGSYGRTEDGAEHSTAHYATA